MTKIQIYSLRIPSLTIRLLNCPFNYCLFAPIVVDLRNINFLLLNFMKLRELQNGRLVSPRLFVRLDRDIAYARDKTLANFVIYGQRKAIGGPAMGQDEPLARGFVVVQFSAPTDTFEKNEKMVMS